MVSDDNNLEALHEFAKKLRMSRSWFQDKGNGSLPHYDLTAERRAWAVRIGAREISRQELVAIMRAHRLQPPPR